MANKAALIKVILQKGKEAIKALLNQDPELIFLSYDAEEGVLIGPDGNTCSLSAIDEMAEKTGAIVFVPVEALTDEQIEEYLNFNH